LQSLAQALKIPTNEKGFKFNLIIKSYTFLKIFNASVISPPGILLCHLVLGSNMLAITVSMGNLSHNSFNEFFKSEWTTWICRMFSSRIIKLGSN
jgi:hypothetical protein